LLPMMIATIALFLFALIVVDNNDYAAHMSLVG
jgi:hypothetical protein